ncbi:AAA domain-containing protein [candidate division WWE3 bacterium]|nr:AAA domain-containing protein [candidate division WWE3 bacterium]
MVYKINRLTLKAKKVLLQVAGGSFSKGEKRSSSFSDSLEVSSGDVLAAIAEVSGMGKRLVQVLEIDHDDLPKSVDIGNLVKGAYFEALRLQQPYVGSEHLFLSLLKLNNSDLYESAQQKLSRMSVFPQIFAEAPKKEEAAIIDLFATHLNLQVAAEPDRVLVDREVLPSVMSILLQKENANPLIVGDPGVGKRTLVKLLAQKMNEMEVPSGLLGYRIYEVDLLTLITNNLNKGDLEATLAAFYAELQKLNRVIISIKNFEDLFFTTNTGIAVPLIYNSFRAQMDDLNIPVIATISDEVYSRLVSENPRVLSNFRVVELDEPNEEKTREILESVAAYLGEHHSVNFTPDIVQHVFEKVENLDLDNKFPQKGIELLDRAASKVLLRKAQVPEEYKDLLEESILLTQGLDKSLEVREYDEALRIRDLIAGIEQKMSVNEVQMFGKQHYRVAKRDVETAFEDYDEEPEEVFDSDISSLSSLELRIKERIIGQDEAVALVSRALLRARLGLRSKKRPLGNFLFLGPTGVGKTELAKVLSDEFFGEDSLIRLDMSDFGEKHTVARLVGAPPGYVGYGDGGELTSKIERNPGSLVLFDEIEKAHPDVLNILLQITEEGELVDAKGTTFDFSSAVVVLTSNLGTEIVHRKGIGFEPKFLNDTSLEKRLRSNLKKILKPELLNRLDEIVVFKRLSKDDQYQILDLMLGDVRANLEEQDVTIRFSHKAKEVLLKLGYSDEYGARALRRTVERELLDRIAEVLLEHTERPLKLSAVGRDDSVLVRVL